MTHSELLRAVEIEPGTEARSSVIWLHGLGADGHDFEPIVPELRLPPATAVRFVFPHAPSIPVTINGGMVMPAWYDILEIALDRRIDEAGVHRSARAVTALLQRERERGIPSERIVLAGFSQGGAVACHVALRHPEPLAGLVMLSTYLVCADELESERSAANASLPIFQAHGDFDPMVTPERGQAARQRLEDLGYAVEAHTYPMAHQVCGEEIQALGAWLAQRLS